MLTGRDSDTIDRRIHDDEVRAVAAVVGPRMPTLPATFRRAATCLYTNTPDEHFVIAPHPRHPRAVVACGSIMAWLSSAVE